MRCTVCRWVCGGVHVNWCRLVLVLLFMPDNLAPGYTAPHQPRARCASTLYTLVGFFIRSDAYDSVIHD
jgi:hypothetical protein